MLLLAKVSAPALPRCSPQSLAICVSGILGNDESRASSLRSPSEMPRLVLFRAPQPHAFPRRGVCACSARSLQHGDIGDSGRGGAGSGLVTHVPLAGYNSSAPEPPADEANVYEEPPDASAIYEEPPQVGWHGQDAPRASTWVRAPPVPSGLFLPQTSSSCLHSPKQQGQARLAALGRLRQTLRWVVAGLCHAAALPLQMWWMLGFLSVAGGETSSALDSGHRGGRILQTVVLGGAASCAVADPVLRSLAPPNEAQRR